MTSDLTLLWHSTNSIYADFMGQLLPYPMNQDNVKPKFSSGLKAESQHKLPQKLRYS